MLRENEMFPDVRWWEHRMCPAECARYFRKELELWPNDHEYNRIISRELSLLKYALETRTRVQRPEPREFNYHLFVSRHRQPKTKREERFLRRFIEELMFPPDFEVVGKGRDDGMPTRYDNEWDDFYESFCHDSKPLKRYC